MKLQQLIWLFIYLLASTAWAAGPGADPTYEELSQHLQKEGNQSLESTLAWLNEEFPQYMRHFTLAFKSGSLQDSSSLFPRAIVFGDNASLILTFNGHPHQKGFHKIEVMHFQESDARFVFREIEFNKGQAKISPENPSQCLACHIDHKPIWEPYRTWPGIYGSQDDVIRPNYTTDEPNDYITALMTEWSHYMDFLKHKDAHRYKWLNFPEGTPVPPYIDEEFSPLYQFRPNLKLTKLLAERHAQTLASKIIRQASCFESLGPLLMNSLYECSSYRDPSLKNDREKAHEIYVSTFGTDPIVGWRGGNTPSVLTDLLPMFGIEQLNWHLSLAPKVWSFVDGNDKLSDHLRARLRGEFSNLPEGDPCTYFARLSEARLKDKSILHCPETRAPATPTVRMCQSCHDGNPIVSIEFTSKSFWMENPQLARKLVERIGSHDPNTRMPPTRALTLGERRGLLRYLSELAPKVFPSSN